MDPYKIRHDKLVEKWLTHSLAEIMDYLTKENLDSDPDLYMAALEAKRKIELSQMPPTPKRPFNPKNNENGTGLARDIPKESKLNDQEHLEKLTEGIIQENRQITIDMFLTPQQIRQATKLKNAADICKQIIEPNIQEINAKLGQENDPKYLACACEYVISRLPKK